ncbi:methyltransferase family protein [Roseiarcus fermentans]|uniref:Methyltransferase family protein n=1 Tax=Roseiarcus fermentans TaxID=1473586 RepID=A0A366F572_9HYPH|nr:class I SAM-dependent methyltransferase [Roseiarcus fermentans]RBP09764.1 methyltransferase family protein [Roseiarcus fermentans]
MTEPAAAMWDERYRPPSYAYGLAPNAFLAAQSERLQRGWRALVPGDGEGRNGVWLAQQGLHVDTFDLSAHGVAKARALAAERGVSIDAAQADALTWDWPEARYDLIALIYLHLVEPERRIVHAHALKALKPGGLIVLEAFRPEQIDRHAAGARGGPRDRALLYRLADLREDFSGEQILLLEAADVRVEEGHLHVGDSAVVRALVRKR